ncbi:chaperone protein DnaJ-like [Xyrauchen texanus]|uniref:chaperone protein DnaJ-like n=1 Tax=Xyrauchen texanus TaxID=154827 RepID=UPI0022425836|nr:chaperone protein DnaJ-like [Xyrauchen texanus]
MSVFPCLVDRWSEENNSIISRWKQNERSPEPNQDVQKRCYSESLKLHQKIQGIPAATERLKLEMTVSYNRFLFSLGFSIPSEIEESLTHTLLRALEAVGPQVPTSDPVMLWQVVLQTFGTSVYVPYVHKLLLIQWMLWLMQCQLDNILALLKQTNNKKELSAPVNLQIVIRNLALTMEEDSFLMVAMAAKDLKDLLHICTVIAQDFGFNGINGFHQGGGRRHRTEPLHAGGGRRKVQDPPVVHELKVSLEEIFHGCTKRMRITHQRVNPDRRTMRTEDKILNIVIKRGWKEGTKITFPKEGDETPENIPADIAFVLKDKGHPLFKRDSANIIYTAKISLKEALCGCTVNIPTIDNRVIPLPCNDLIKPSTIKRLRGEGLPFPKNPSQRGDLIVEFQVRFPDRIPPQSREIIKQHLPQS